MNDQVLRMKTSKGMTTNTLYFMKVRREDVLYYSDIWGVMDHDDRNKIVKVV